MARKKFRPHLDFYNKFAESKVMPGAFVYAKPSGLCFLSTHNYLKGDLLDLFEPTDEDDKWLEWEGFDRTWWASENKDPMLGVFTPLRQTIVLFMAAMNNEL